MSQLNICFASVVVRKQRIIYHSDTNCKQKTRTCPIAMCTHVLLLANLLFASYYPKVRCCFLRISYVLPGGLGQGFTCSLCRSDTAHRRGGSDGNGINLAGTLGGEGGQAECVEITDRRSRGRTPHRRGGAAVTVASFFGVEEGCGRFGRRRERAWG